MAELSSSDEQDQIMDGQGAANIERVHCPYPNCGKSYSDRFAYSKHKRAVHKLQDEVKRPAGYERPEKCIKCGNNYKTKDTLRKHICKDKKDSQQNQVANSTSQQQNAQKINEDNKDDADFDNSVQLQKRQASESVQDLELRMRQQNQSSGLILNREVLTMMIRPFRNDLESSGGLGDDEEFSEQDDLEQDPGQNQSNKEFDSEAQIQRLNDPNQNVDSMLNDNAQMQLEIIKDDSIQNEERQHHDAIFKGIASLANDQDFTAKFIDKVYNAINKRTETMWNLPQLPDLKAPLRQSLRSTLKFNADPMVKDNPVSLAYGEATKGSINKLLDLFQMAKEDSFADVGSGFGKVVIHVAAVTQCHCYGIEIDQTRLSQSVEFVRGMAAACKSNQRVADILDLVQFRKGDCNINDYGDGFQDSFKKDISHIYTFNVRFSEASNLKIATALKLTPKFKMLAWCINDHLTTNYYGLNFLELVDKFYITITGSNEKHSCYVYKNLGANDNDAADNQFDVNRHDQKTTVNAFDITFNDGDMSVNEEEKAIDGNNGLEQINQDSIYTFSFSNHMIRQDVDVEPLESSVDFNKVIVRQEQQQQFKRQVKKYLDKLEKAYSEFMIRNEAITSVIIPLRPIINQVHLDRAQTQQLNQVHSQQTLNISVDLKKAYMHLMNEDRFDLDLNQIDVIDRDSLTTAIEKLQAVKAINNDLQKTLQTIKVCQDKAILQRDQLKGKINQLQQDSTKQIVFACVSRFSIDQTQMQSIVKTEQGQVFKCIGQFRYFIRYLPQVFAMKVKTFVTPSLLDEDEVLNELAANQEKNGSEFIIKYLGYKEILTGWAMAFEYVPYRLDQLIKNPSKIKNSTQKDHIVMGLVNGMAFAHQIGIYHRNLRPDKILITESMVPKICGWSLSRCQHNCGTSGYMAPELYNPFITIADLDKCDSWSLGCVLYEIYNDGRKLFNSESDVNAFVQSGVELGISHKATVSMDAVDLISKLLQRDPKNRYAISALKDHQLFKALQPIASANRVQDISAVVQSSKGQ